MKTFPDNHFSAVVTDPPYGLHFMGKDWDEFNKNNFDEKPDKFYTEARGMVRDIRCANASSGTYDPRRDDEFQQFIRKVAIEALRIVKPGGHILMFGAPRRYHRQVCALEDAGWEIRDCLMWIFGSGFPKSHNHFGIEGFGTALKPAYEPIIMAMKPLEGTFKQNAEKWGQAGINIDGCRIPSDARKICNYDSQGSQGCISRGSEGNHSGEQYNERIETKGRWPANVIFDEEAAQLLDRQTSHLHSAGHARDSIRKCENKGIFALPGDGNRIGDSGGASRFFYCAKTSSRERNEGLEGLPDHVHEVSSPGRLDNKGQTGNPYTTTSPTPRKNSHPTVKPLRLMEYLIRLVMPPKDGLLLDPFAGSGSTILAAKRLGFSAIGIEKQPEYAEIARARIDSFKIEEPELDLFEASNA